MRPTLKYWKLVLNFIAVLNLYLKGDDLYLIRLMEVTGPCIGKMSINCLKIFFSRLSDLLGSNFLERVLFGFLFEGLEEKNIIDDLNVEEQNWILEILEGMEGRPALILSEHLKEYLKI